MITNRTATECGFADYGWLQARYTFSFGHYFDPQMLGYASLRVLNQEVLAVGAAFQPRTYPQADILNLVLQGRAEYRDSQGNHIQAQAGDALLLAAQAGVTYSEHNIGAAPLTRLQLWLDACPNRENPLIQKVGIGSEPHRLLASPEGEAGSLVLRQQAWIHHIELAPGENLSVDIRGSRAYMQSIHGTVRIDSRPANPKVLTCGDGAFIHDEPHIRLRAQTPLKGLLIDLAG